MSSGIERFEKFWREMDLGAHERYIHPKDVPLLKPEEHPQFQLQALPIPVLGNLRSAEAVILALNAGFGDQDVAWQAAWPSEHAEMTAAQVANIRQEHHAVDYPFYDFNPRFRTHPGVAYWKGGAELAVRRRQQAKLRGVATELEQNWKLPAADVHRYLAHKVAVLEWCPYRSKSFKQTPGLKKLPSVLEAQELARALVRENDKLVIVARHVTSWGYSGSADSKENLVVYDGLQGTSASLTMNSAGGKALLQRLLRAGPAL